MTGPLDDSIPSGPSTTQPSPTSTIFQPDGESEPVMSGHEPGGRIKRPDEERDLGGVTEKRNRQSEPRTDLSGEKGQDWTVIWDGPDDPGCPLNTPPWKKWYVGTSFISEANTDKIG